MSTAAVQSAALSHVTVAAFDIHLWSKPFDPTQFNPLVHFLGSAPEYRATRAAGQKLELAELVLFPLKNELAVGRNPFWYRFDTAIAKLTTDPTAVSDTREFLWPLRCRPKDFKLAWANGTHTNPPNVWATIWLWPFGWSSTIEFRFAAPFSLDDLAALGGQLREKSPGPFALGGERLSLSQAFQRLGELLRRNICTAGNPPADVTHLSRHVVVSLQLPKGMRAPGYAPGVGEPATWSAADRLRMVGALRGQKVALQELVGGKTFLFTPLGDRNFAVTDFNEGTLLVLRHRKDRSGATRETNHCLFANLRSFSAVYLALHRLSQYAKNRPDIAGVVAHAKELLAGLPEEYRNAVCVNFKKHFAS